MNLKKIIILKSFSYKDSIYKINKIVPEQCSKKGCLMKRNYKQGRVLVTKQQLTIPALQGFFTSFNRYRLKSFHWSNWLKQCNNNNNNNNNIKYLCKYLISILTLTSRWIQNCELYLSINLK